MIYSEISLNFGNFQDWIQFPTETYLAKLLQFECDFTMAILKLFSQVASCETNDTFLNIFLTFSQKSHFLNNSLQMLRGNLENVTVICNFHFFISSGYTKKLPVFKSLSRPDNFLKCGDTGHQCLCVAFKVIQKSLKLFWHSLVSNSAQF